MLESQPWFWLKLWLFFYSRSPNQRMPVCSAPETSSLVRQYWFGPQSSLCFHPWMRQQYNKNLYVPQTYRLLLQDRSKWSVPEEAWGLCIWFRSLDKRIQGSGPFECFHWLECIWILVLEKVCQETSDSWTCSTRLLLVDLEIEWLCPEISFRFSQQVLSGNQLQLKLRPSLSVFFPSSLCIRDDIWQISWLTRINIKNY